METYLVARRSRPKRALRTIGECLHRRAQLRSRLARRTSRGESMLPGRNLIRRREAFAAVAGFGLAPKLLFADLADPDSAMLPNYLAGRLNTVAGKWRA